jgi:hypothetical protein
MGSRSSQKFSEPTPGVTQGSQPATPTGPFHVLFRRSSWRRRRCGALTPPRSTRSPPPSSTTIKSRECLTCPGRGRVVSQMSGEQQGAVRP